MTTDRKEHDAIVAEAKRIAWLHDEINKKYRYYGTGKDGTLYEFDNIIGLQYLVVITDKDGSVERNYCGSMATAKNVVRSVTKEGMTAEVIQVMMRTA